MSDDDLAAAVTALKAGHVVAVPTDTLYGLAVDPAVPGATARLFEVKRRPREVAVPLLVADLDQARACAVALPEQLVARLWPGALTVIVRRARFFIADLGGDSTTVGLRCPRHEVIRGLCTVVGPLAVSSANRHGASTPPTAEGIRELFGDEVAVVVDGGTCDGSPSTVVDCTGEVPVVVRAGAIPTEVIAAQS